MPSSAPTDSMRQSALRGMTAAAVVLLGGCAGERPGVKSLPAVPAAMPKVEAVHVGSSVNDSIDDRIMKIDVDDRGVIAMIPTMTSNPRIRFVDSTGHFAGGAGPIGEGPGELGFPARVWWTATGLVAYETNRLVRVQYDQNGRLTGEEPHQLGLVPLAESEEGMIEFTYNWRERQRPPSLLLRRFDRKRADALLDDRHPQLRQSLGEAPGVAITYPWPVVAADAGVLALVEPRTPIVWYFSLAGVLLDSVVLEGASRLRGPKESAEELAVFARASRQGARGPDGKYYPGPDFDSVQALFRADHPPAAFIHGANFDGKGRLWIIGPHNDSTRALVLSGTRLLGQLMLPCFRVGRFVAVSDRWVALLCSNGDEAEQPFQLQLYRIMEPATKLP